VSLYFSLAMFWSVCRLLSLVLMQEQERRKLEEAIADDPSRWVNTTGRYELCGVVTHKAHFSLLSFGKTRLRLTPLPGTRRRLRPLRWLGEGFDGSVDQV
jgi:hypothetical protein